MSIISGESQTYNLVTGARTEMQLDLLPDWWRFQASSFEDLAWGIEQGRWHCDEAAAAGMTNESEHSMPTVADFSFEAWQQASAQRADMDWETPEEGLSLINSGLSMSVDDAETRRGRSKEQLTAEAPREGLGCSERIDRDTVVVESTVCGGPYSMPDHTDNAEGSRLVKPNSAIACAGTGSNEFDCVRDLELARRPTSTVSDVQMDTLTSDVTNAHASEIKDPQPDHSPRRSPALGTKQATDAASCVRTESRLVCSCPWARSRRLGPSLRGYSCWTCKLKLVYRSLPQDVKDGCQGSSRQSAS